MCSTDCIKSVDDSCDCDKYMTVDKWTSSPLLVSNFKRCIFMISLHTVTDTMDIGQLRNRRSDDRIPSAAQLSTHTNKTNGFADREAYDCGIMAPTMTDHIFTVISESFRSQ